MIAAIAALLLAPPGQGEISERLISPVAFTLTSAKPLSALEFCVADQFSIIGPVSIVHDGPDRMVLLIDDRGSYFGAIDVRRSSDRTTLVARVKAKGWHARLQAWLTRCL